MVLPMPYLCLRVYAIRFVRSRDWDFVREREGFEASMWRIVSSFAEQ